MTFLSTYPPIIQVSSLLPPRPVHFCLFFYSIFLFSVHFKSSSTNTKRKQMGRLFSSLVVKNANSSTPERKTKNIYTT